MNQTTLPTVSTRLKERLQPIYAVFLAEHGIASGDIDPLSALAIEKAERRLASAIAHVLSMASDTEVA